MTVRYRLTGKRCTALLLAAALCVFCPCFFAKARETAGFSGSLSETEGNGKDAVSLSLAYDGSLGEIGAFLTRVEYDPDYLEFQRTGEGDLSRSGYSLTQPEEGVISSGYVKKDGREGILLSDELLCYRFRVREDAPEGETELSLFVYQILAPDFSELEPVEQVLRFTVLPPPSTDAALISLQPETGELSPAFSPDCFDYTMTVPFSVTSLEFLAEPAESAVCRINRKNLGAGGSDTDFLITVTAEDGRTKSVYRVTVHREERAVAAGTSQGSASRSDPGSSSGTRSNSTPESKPAEAPEREPSQPVRETAASPAVSAAGKSSSPAEVYPSVTIAGGHSSRFPMVCSVLIMVLAVLVSGPLARWICAVIPAKSPGKEDGEQEDHTKEQ